MSALSVLIAFVMHVIKYVTEMEIRKRDIFEGGIPDYEELSADNKAKSDELLAETRTTIISMYVWSTLLIVLFVLSSCAAKLYNKNA